MEELRTATTGLRREVVAPGARRTAGCGVAIWIAVALLSSAALRAHLAPGAPPASHLGGER